MLTKTTERFFVAPGTTTSPEQTMSCMLRGSYSKDFARKRKTDESFKDQLTKFGLKYDIPPPNESKKVRRVRLQKMRRALNKHEKRRKTDESYEDQLTKFGLEYDIPNVTEEDRKVPLQKIC